MSVHIIYYKDGAKFMRPVLTREKYLQLRGSARQKATLKAVREGDGQQKRNLLQMNYSCLPSEDGALRGATRLSTTVGMDVDHIAPEEMTAVKERILQKKDELGLLMLERSARGAGYHLVFRRRAELTQEENLQWASDLLGVAFDSGAKDITRVFFTTTEEPEELIWLEDGLFESEELRVKSEESVEVKNEERKTKNEEPDDAKSEEQPTANGQWPTAFKGVSYASIISEYFRRTGGEPQEGERNKRLHQLAANLRAVCDNSEAWLLELMPRYGLSEEEMRRIIHSACKEPTKGSRLMDRIIGELGEKDEVQESLASAMPPAMPERLPRLIQLLTSNTPAEYRAAVAHAVFPALATHLCDVRFRYTDNVEHEATLMNCLMAGTGAGKGCIDEPIRRIMADIRRRDAENERREKEWKKDCQKKGANKDKMARPEGLVIQIIDSDMTKPALVTRMDEAEGHFVYVKLNELDLFEQLRGQTGKQHFQLMCLAFDPGAEYGQTRVGTQSVTARPVCRFNWNACTTILKGRRFFGKVLTDGPVSRINFCTIPEEEIGGEQPVYGAYDAAFDEALKPYIDNLVSARGLTDCPQAFRLIGKLQRECADFARLSQNGTYWNLSHRACVIAWLKACVLYVANGMKWEKSIEEFVRWSLNYDLWCKMQFFGEDIERANNGEGSRIGSRGPRNLLELLPDDFTLEDARRVRCQQGLGAEKTGNMIATWKKRGYVVQMADGSFHRSTVRLSNFTQRMS